VIIDTINKFDELIIQGQILSTVDYRILAVCNFSRVVVILIGQGAFRSNVLFT